MGDFKVWSALTIEFIGTFLLVLIGASAVALTLAQGGTLLGSAFAFGLALMVLIYMWGSYSGAHFNPAVSFGFAVAGQMNWWLMLGYWVVQLLGAIAAAALVSYFFGTANGAGASVGSLTNTDAWKAVLFEAFLTFFLVLAYLFIYRNPLLAIIAGGAIGLVLTFSMLAAGPLTGASLNPARSLGPAIFSNNMGTYWIYVVGPLLGALFAALIYKLLTVDFSCCDKTDECGNVIKDECGRPLKECRRPIYDNCGNHVETCDGKQYETYTKHERIIGFMPESIPMYIGEWMSAHGFDPRYLKQEFGHAVDKVLPGGVVRDPQAVVQNVIQTTTPGVQTVTTQLTTPAAGFGPGPTLSQVSTLSPAPGLSTISTVQPANGLSTVQSVNGFATQSQGLSSLAPGSLSSLAPVQSTNQLMGAPQGFQTQPQQGFGSAISNVISQGTSTPGLVIPNVPSPVM